MKEVSCRLACLLIEVAEQAFSVEPRDLLEGLSEDPKTLADPHARIDWQSLCEILERIEKRIGRDGILNFHDRASTRGRATRFHRRLAGLFSDAPRLYWFHAMRLGPAMCSHLERRHTARLDGSIVIEHSLPMSHGDCPAFWHVTTSQYRTLPRMLGQADALIDAEISNRRAVYRITPPPPLTFQARLRYGLRGFFASQSTAELLRDQAREIARIHEALVKTREELDRQTALAARDEQRRIARDLHDGLGQHLTAIAFQCQLLEDSLPGHAAETTALSRGVREASMLARSLAHGLAAEDPPR